MTYEQFSAIILHMDGVTMIGPQHAVVVGVETDEDAIRLRPHIDPFIPMIVTGPILMSVTPITVAKHSAVQKYEQVMGSGSIGG